VIVKDTDAREDMRAALREAREHYRSSPVVIGVQDTEQECWLITGFDPADAEKSRMDDICRGDFPPGVGFDPRGCSERLTATKKDTEKLSPKRVLNYLVGGDRDRAYRGLHADNHATLKDRGKGNGLSDFLEDLEQRLVRGVFGVVVQS
jgi:hypothetical protein